MKTLIIATAFVFGVAGAHQAAACDMGAIETVVRAACPGEGCASKPVSHQTAQDCNGTCGQASTPAPTAACVGNGCASDASAPSTPTVLACQGSGC